MSTEPRTHVTEEAPDLEEVLAEDDGDDEDRDGDTRNIGLDDYQEP